MPPKHAACSLTLRVTGFLWIPSPWFQFSHFNTDSALTIIFHLLGLLLLLLPPLTLSLGSTQQLLMSSASRCYCAEAAPWDPSVHWTRLAAWAPTAPCFHHGVPHYSRLLQTPTITEHSFC